MLWGRRVNVDDSEFEALLKKYKKMTVIGVSPHADRPSQRIPLYMQSHGYEIVGVNPGHSEIAGLKIYPKLKDVPAEYRKFVDVFRRNDAIPEVVDEAIAAGGVEVLWLQLGITHPEAEKKAEAAGIRVVSDRCLLVEHRNYI